MMFSPNREELAWCAGFFDGEGSVGVAIKNGRHNFYLGISQVDRRVLDRFHNAVGCGKVAGPYVHRVMELRGNEQPRFYFQTQRFESIQAIIAMLWTWLSPVKRKQAHLALETMRGHGNGQVRAKHWLACKRGHPRTPENVEIHQFKGYECRRCLVCRREAQRHLYLKRKTAAALLVAV